MAITHSTVATKADEVGAEVNKAEWNADHTIEAGTITPAQTQLGRPAWTYRIENDSGTYVAVKHDGTTVSSNTTLETVLDAVITDISTSSASIEFGEGDFSLTDEWDISGVDGLTIKGQGVGVTKLILAAGVASTNKSIISADNTQTESAGTTVFAINDIAAEANTITLDTGSQEDQLVKGDILNILSDEEIDADSNSQGGEFGQIRSITTDDSGVITLESQVYEDYPTGSVGPQIMKLAMQKNVTIRDITFKDERAVGNDNNGQASGIYVNLIRNCVIENCEFVDCWYAAIQLNKCLDSRVSNNYINVVNEGSNAIHYGFLNISCQNLLVQNNSFLQTRHACSATTNSGSALSTQGWCIACSVIGNSSWVCDNAHFDVHQGSQQWMFKDNTAHGQDSTANAVWGYQSRSNDGVIDGNYAHGGGGFIRTFEDATQDGGVHRIQIINNRQSGILQNDITTGIIIAEGSTEYLIANNFLTGDRAGYIGLDIRGAASDRPNLIQIVNNFIDGRNGSASIGVIGDSNININISFNTFYNLKTSITFAETDTATLRLNIIGNTSQAIDDATAIVDATNTGGNETLNTDG